jgi:hypothetical protein
MQGLRRGPDGGARIRIAGSGRQIAAFPYREQIQTIVHRRGGDVVIPGRMSTVFVAAAPVRPTPAATPAPGAAPQRHAQARADLAAGGVHRACGRRGSAAHLRARCRLPGEPSGLLAFDLADSRTYRTGAVRMVIRPPRRAQDG